MKFEPFALERFQSIWENRVAWNVAESGVHPLRLSELADTEAFRNAVLEQELGYPQTNGTVALREAIAAMYAGATIDHVQVTNGGSEANCVLLMRLLEPGDEIVFMSPNYMQIAGLARALGAAVKPWRPAERSAGDRTESAARSGGATIQPIRSPGSPYAFESPLVTIARSYPQFHTVAVSSASRSAPR